MKGLIIILFVLLSMIARAQPSNANCSDATLIENPAQYCSSNTEFTTQNAGDSQVSTSGCFENVQDDVWFQFTAIASAVNVLINGDLGGNLSRPRIALYEGDCSDMSFMEVTCEETNGGADIVSFLVDNLVVGVNYKIRVGGAQDNAGSFQICVNNFNPPTEPGQDANAAAVLCDKTGFVIQVLSGGGQDNDEASGTCLDVGASASENQSSWTTWIADNDGELTFTINPLNANDDIDFVVYELPDGIDDFSTRIAIRCMASSCVGPTGLKSTSSDLIENPGCVALDDNFVQSIMQEEGKAYALLINNFSNTGAGVSLEFGGDAEFKGPEPDFEIMVSDNVLTCDKVVDIIDNSMDNLGNLIDYQWNFGEDASPQTAQGVGPFDVTYATFGPKFIVLTITSDLGCRITEVREVEVLPCCADASAVNIDITDQQNIGCAMAEFGSFSIEGSGGFPTYSYSFEGSEFNDQTSFFNLSTGDYEVRLIDRKGCEVSRIVTIMNVNPITVDAGEDRSVEYLGDSLQLDGSFDSDGAVSILWSPSENVNCPDGTANCLDPIVTPLGTTTYTLIISDADGCVSTDEVVVEVLKIRPVYAPTAFSPNEDGVNDHFALVGNPFSVQTILEFFVYDRWGNKVYEGRNLTPNDINGGWDGKVNGVPSGEGVYIWFAKLEFFDESIPPETITGDVTLLR